jgi:NADPH2:quinone reductase
VPAIEPMKLAGRSLFLTRPSLHHYIETRAELEARAAEVLGLIADQKLSIAIDSELPLAEVAKAHELLESRATSGKLLLIPQR